MLFRAESKGVHVNALIRSTGVDLVGLDPREVGSLTLREAVLAVQLELGNDDGVLAPAVHVQRGLRENEGSGIRDGGALGVVNVGGVGELSQAGQAKSGQGGSLGLAGANGDVLATEVGLIISTTSDTSVPVSGEAIGVIGVHGTGVLEKTAGINEGTLAGNVSGSTEGVDGVGKGINGISVVERLGTKDLEQGGIAQKR